MLRPKKKKKQKKPGSLGLTDKAFIHQRGDVGGGTRAGFGIAPVNEIVGKNLVRRLAPTRLASTEVDSWARRPEKKRSAKREIRRSHGSRCPSGR